MEVETSWGKGQGSNPPCHLPFLAPSLSHARPGNMLSSFTEGELEAEWLQDVGLSTLISGAEEEDGQALLSTLTRTQAAAVQKRYNTYTQTLRKKNKHTVRDVRDIFGTSDSSVSS